MLKPITDRFKLIAEAHLFLLSEDERILLLRRCNTEYENGSYSVIAGKVEADEEVTAAAIREAKEEVGIDVPPADVEVVGVMHRKGADGLVSVAFFLSARTWSGDVVNAEPENHEDVSWHSVDELPANMIAYVRQALRNYRQGRYYDSFGWDEPVRVKPGLMPDRFKVTPDAHVFLISDRHEVLLLRRCNTGFEDGSYSVIAGHVEADEEVTSAAIREAKEEVGVEIQPADIKVVGVMHRRSDHERVSFFLTASRWRGEIVNAEPGMCDDVSWHSVHRLPANTIPYISQALTNYRHGRFYDGFGWNNGRKP